MVLLSRGESKEEMDEKIKNFVIRVENGAIVDSIRHWFGVIRIILT
jgi:hypothetical protein